MEPITKKKTNKKPRSRVLITILSVYFLSLAMCFWISYQIIAAEAHVRYTGMVNIAAEKIANTIKGMERSANNVFDEVTKQMDTPDAVINALRSKSDLNAEVRGYFAAFEPNYFPEMGRWFEPYVHQADTTGEYSVRQVGSARHNYFKSEWYVRAKEAKHALWSEPYYYYDGTSISGHYTTFVKPIYDAKGKLICICGADMTFEWLAKELAEMDEMNKENIMMSKYRMFRDLDFYTVILDHDGTCIASPEGKAASTSDEEVVSDLTEGKYGIAKMVVDDKPSTVYYGPIKHIDWSIAIVVPQYDILNPLLVVGGILLAIAFIGFIIIILVYRKVKYAETI